MLASTHAARQGDRVTDILNANEGGSACSCQYRHRVSIIAAYKYHEKTVRTGTLVRKCDKPGKELGICSGQQLRAVNDQDAAP